MGWFKRRRLIRQTARDQDFVWESVKTVADELKLRPKRQEEYFDIKGKLGGFKLIISHNGYVSVEAKTLKMGLLLSTSENDRDFEGSPVTSGDAEFDGRFVSCFAPPELLARLKDAREFRRAAVRFCNTWVGGKWVGGNDHVRFQTEDLEIYVDREVVPFLGYHPGENEYLTTAEELQAALHSYFSDLRALAEAFEDAFEIKRYRGVSRNERKRRKQRDRELIKHVEDGDLDQFYVDVVKEMLASGADPSAAARDCNSALIMAIERGTNDEPKAIAAALDAARVLLEAGAAVDARNDEGKTALLLAANQHSLEAVELLLEFGADGKVVAQGWNTVMFVADTFMDVEDADRVRKMCSRLIEAGADINAMSSEDVVLSLAGETPLSLAEEKGLEVLVEVLKSLGAER